MEYRTITFLGHSVRHNDFITIILEGRPRKPYLEDGKTRMGCENCLQVKTAGEINSESLQQQGVVVFRKNRS